jgi:phage shock protein C
MDTSTRRLTRSQHDRVIAGVAGGVAAYLGVDSLLVRLAFVALFFTGGGALLYPILWIIMPLEGSAGAVPGQAFQEMKVQFERAGERLRHAVSHATTQHVSQNADDETEIPINNMNPGISETTSTERNRQLGILLVGIGVLFVASMIFGPLFGKLLFPIVLVVGGLIILGRNAQRG